ncbi:MAG: methylated-DNA--[protein]-cysteine S-methyltransferase [Pseudomonadota bacterium]|nr:methylated-DNA--[protein]-cysteine S-methyltransferase [Pseudomonadota bacterium]
MFTSSITTPLGHIRARASTTGVTALDWQQQPFSWPDQENDVSRETAHQLLLYLVGNLEIFALPLDLSGQSEAFRRWLTVMSAIPYGQTITYKDFAKRWGNKKAARAAGQACQRNPLPIILPCHRVVRSDGTFDNYSGGDRTTPRDPENIKRKQWLIDLEARHRRTA